VKGVLFNDGKGSYESTATQKGMTMGIMMRNARTDWDAFLLSEATENNGGEVISIAYNGEHKLQGAMIPCSKFVVFSRVPDEAAIDRIDEAFYAALDKVGN
jgi:hypothetical protein